MNALQIKGTKVYCFDPHFKSLKLMGQKIGDTFFKRVTPLHFMRVANAYGFQYDAFASFELNGIENISILESHTGITWESKTKDWFTYGSIADYGRGKQIFLSPKYMHRKNKEAIAEEKQRIEAIRDKTISNA